MGLSKQVEIRALESIESGMAVFYTPQASHETMLVQVPASARDNLFCHHFQTDQLLVVRGSFVLAVLQNGQYQYIPLSDRTPAVVKVPPGVPHAAINFSNEPCLVVNAVLRHGPVHPKDYQPMKPRIPYDIAAARSALDKLQAIPISA